MSELENTLILIKPDGVQRSLIGEIISRIERKDLKIVALKMINATEKQAKEHYYEHEGRDYFVSLIEFITSGPIVAINAQGERAIEAFRQLAGGTDPVAKALCGTIRGDFGLQTQKNLVHGSDSVESADRELKIWFN